VACGSAQRAPHELPAEEGSYDGASADMDMTWTATMDAHPLSSVVCRSALFLAVLRIRIQIRLFLGLLDQDLDLLVRGMDPDPAPDPE
jgi:hypothetical protein